MKRTAQDEGRTTLGTRLAEKTRAVANELSDEEREAPRLTDRSAKEGRIL